MRAASCGNGLIKQGLLFKIFIYLQSKPLENPCFVHFQVFNHSSCCIEMCTQVPCDGMLGIIKGTTKRISNYTSPHPLVLLGV